MKLFIKLFIITLSLISGNIVAQKSDFKAVLKINYSASNFETDIFGNIYMINNNKITKFNSNGEIITSWASNNMSQITSIDVSNPFKILVCFGNLGIVQLLDNFLTPISANISFTEIGLYPPIIVCNSYYGGFWIYNNSLFLLQKYDENLSLITKSHELKINDKPIEPYYITEFKNNVYISDTNIGIIITDKYGALIKIVPLNKIKEFNCYDDYIIYTNNDNIVFFNYNTLTQSSLKIPVKDVLKAQVKNNKLYVLNNQGLYVFNLSF